MTTATTPAAQQASPSPRTRAILTLAAIVAGTVLAVILIAAAVQVAPDALVLGTWRALADTVNAAWSWITAVGAWLLSLVGVS